MKLPLRRTRVQQECNAAVYVNKKREQTFSKPHVPAQHNQVLNRI